MRFNAVIVEPSLGEITANMFFADPETNPDEPSVLMFSRPVEPGFEESAYYFEVNDQSYGTYEGLEYVKLSRNSVEIRLNDDTFEKFGVDDFREVRADFDVDDETFEAARETMRRIFKDFDIYEEL